MFGGGIDGQLLCDAPEVELIATAVAAVTVECVDGDIDSEGLGVVTAAEGTETAEARAILRSRLKAEQR